MAVRWRENKMVSFELGDELFALAQLLEEPNVVVFNSFRTCDDWGDVDAESFDILFYCVVLGNVYSSPKAAHQKSVKPAQLEVPRYWIRDNSLHKEVTAWKGTKHEVTFGFMGTSATLVDTLEDVVIEDPATSDSIDKDVHVLDGMYNYTTFFERIRLCHKFGKNVDPYKDILLDRELPIDYKDFVGHL